MTTELSTKTRLVVVGNGMVAGRLLELLKAEAGSQYDITVFGEENTTNYDRVQLSPVLAGEKTLQQVIIHDDDWYKSNGIQLLKGVGITSINIEERTLLCSQGLTHSYDKLVMATGSQPFVLPVPGAELDGVVCFRTLDDVEQLLSASATKKKAVVIGGGLLGIEAANGLQKQGMDVSLVHLADSLMERQLDKVAGDLLKQRLQSLGINCLLGKQTSKFVGTERVSAVEFSDGSRVDADLVVMAVGVRPRTELAQDAGLQCNRGVVVDDYLQTSAQSVYAIGECAEHDSVCYGIVAPLYEQAKTLADVLKRGEGNAYTGSQLATRLKVSGIDVFSAGAIDAGDDAVYLEFRDEQIPSYKKLIIKENCLIGAVLYGDVADGAWYFKKIQSGESIAHLRDLLIFGEQVCENFEHASTQDRTVSVPAATVNENREGRIMNEKKTLVVIGNGMVGNQFIESFCEKEGSSDYSIVVFCEEPKMAYDRVHLSEYFTGKSAEDLSLVKAGFYEKNDVTVYTNELVSEIDAEKKTVVSSTGRTLGYDKLVIATGSYAFVPPIKGKDHAACFVYRTLDDLDAIKAASENASVGVVVGGGLLGLEAANALKSLGLQTHVVEFAPRLMPMQLDQGGADILRNKIEELGVSVHLNRSTQEITEGDERVLKMNFSDGEVLETDLILFSAGIRPRDEIAKSSGLALGERGGIVINDQCETSVKDIYAIGECANWNAQIFGLVAPGYAMARTAASDILDESAAFTGADMSTKLKLLGVDVGSIGNPQLTRPVANAYTYIDEEKGVYKRILVSTDEKKLLGAILVGDNSDYDVLLQYCLNGMDLPENPDQMILPDRGEGGSTALGGGALPDSAQICSCFNVSKGDIVTAMDGGAMSVAQIKAETGASAGCGGCAALLKSVVDTELETRGVEVNRDICEHFPHTRQDLYNIVRVEGIQSFDELIAKHGKGLGCDICKPAVGAILASTWNDYVLDDKHMALQDTNDFALANIQKDGTYSVVPRIPGGEITPKGLIKIGEVADKYKLYTKITGGQRIDLFGAKLDELPLIWKELTDAGFESGHAYGKAVRTVKSCVGSTWCRYGVDDSAGMSIRVENRYKGLRTPHKTKFAVSGCTRECAEAQSKDVGIIATENGWNLYVCGNGGMKPRHADLLATDLDDEMLLKVIDRFLMFYIKTGDRLQRTSVWMENMEGGLDYLKSVILDDSLGIAAELEKQMDHIVGTYQDEWKTTLNSPVAMKRFRTFVNSTAGDDNVVFVEERGQIRPATLDEKSPDLARVSG